MAVMVKIKIIGIIISMLIFTFSFIYYKVTNEISDSDRIKYWTPDSTLSISDFKQTAPFNFIGHVAVISSGIYWKEKDNGKYITKALIDRYESYFKDYAYSDYLLNHEKYHANITAAISRELNDKLEKITFKNHDQFMELLDSFRLKNGRLQKLYDKETEHSDNIPYQYYWEYKIDSLYYRKNDIINKDEYSSISCYFPSQPEITILADSFLLRKQYVLDKYNMRFRFITDYDSSIDTASFKNNFTKHLDRSGFINSKIREFTENNQYIIESECDDTVENRKFFDRIIYNSPYFYQLTVNYPYFTENDTLYKRMKEQFFNSLNISTNEEYWINIFKKQKSSKAKRVDISNDENNKHEDYNALCTSRYGNFSIMYHRPIFYNQNLIIPFSPIYHESDAIDELILIINDKYIFSQPPDSLEQIICLNLVEHEIKKVKKMQFGYTLKSDSLGKCYHLNGSIFE